MGPAGRLSIRAFSFMLSARLCGCGDDVSILGEMNEWNAYNARVCRSKKEQVTVHTVTYIDLKVMVLSKKSRDRKDSQHHTILVS